MIDHFEGRHPLQPNERSVWRAALGERRGRAVADALDVLLSAGRIRRSGVALGGEPLFVRVSEDAGDAAVAGKILADIKAGKVKTVPHAAVVAGLGLGR